LRDELRHQYERLRAIEEEKTGELQKIKHNLRESKLSLDEKIVEFDQITYSYNSVNSKYTISEDENVQMRLKHKCN
jgi:hypothetical protein